MNYLVYTVANQKPITNKQLVTLLVEAKIKKINDHVQNSSSKTYF